MKLCSCHQEDDSGSDWEASESEASESEAESDSGAESEEEEDLKGKDKAKKGGKDSARDKRRVCACTFCIKHALECPVCLHGFMAGCVTGLDDCGMEVCANIQGSSSSQCQCHEYMRDDLLVQSAFSHCV